ncbi:hypothetical protein ACIBEA_31520 [Streptomyces sp. NPDC051555]
MTVATGAPVCGYAEAPVRTGTGASAGRRDGRVPSDELRRTRVVVRRQ